MSKEMEEYARKFAEREKMLEQRQAELEQYKKALDQKGQAIKAQQVELSQIKEGLTTERQNFDLERQRLGVAGNSAPTQQQQVPNYTFFSTIGSLAEFRIGDDWELYEERLSQYFVANNVPDDRRVATLVTLIGQDAYKTLKDLCDPVLPATKTYTQLCEILKKQFAPKVAAFKERREFFNLTQGDKESVNDWYARIKAKAVKCKFGALLDDKIKDGFITGLKGGPVLDKVFEQEPTASLQEILEVARNKEAALAAKSSNSSTELHKIYSSSTKGVSRRNSADNKTMKDRSTLSRQDRAGSSSQRSREASRESSSEPKCNHCGGVRHNFKNCKYKHYKCKICNRVGHLAKVCRKNGQSCSNNNYIEAKFNDSFEVVDMLKIQDNNIDAEHDLVELVVEKKKVVFEIDTGAGRSVIPESVYKKYFSHCKLEETAVRLRMYDDSLLAPLGEICVNIQNKSRSIQGKLVVVKKGNRPLLGKDLMKPLGFYIASVKFVKEEPEIQSILKKYEDLFDKSLGKYKYEKIEVKLQTDVEPKFVKPRPVPMALKKKLDEQIDKLVEDGVISLTRANAWGTPLVPILKEDGSVRVCADYKVTVNRYVEDIKYPFPRIEEIFAALSGGDKFSKLDLSAAYNQLEVTEESKKILAWSTHRGIYLLNRLPFGIKSACSIFQRTMEKVLQGIEGVVCFLDDIVVTGKNRSEHLKNLDEVCKRLSDAGFRLNEKKCSFFQSEIKYLGHVIDKNGLRKDPEKVAAMVKVPKPSNVQEVQAFVGMVNYYAKFVPTIASILVPLYELTKAKEFNWSKECDTSFESIKREMSTERFLIHFDPKLPIKLSCDASGVGIGAVLSHVLPDGSEKPICFASRVLRKSEKNYSVIHREALAIYWAAHKFYQYLVGTEFILCSDHKPLQILFGEEKGLPQMAAGRLQRWALFLSGLKYKFQYVPGKSNGGADGLSRLPVESVKKEVLEDDYFHFIVEDRVPVTAEQICKETSRDKVLSKVFLYTRNGWPKLHDEELSSYARRANEISLEKNILMWGYRVIIPTSLRPILLDEIHSTHLGMAKMKAVARQYFWWPKLDSDIENYVRDCEACMTVSRAPPKAKLIKFKEALVPFERVHLDFLGPFNGKVYLIIVDAFSKWPEIYEMEKMNSSSTIEKLRECFARFGLPQMIFTDNGKQFTSEEFASFCKVNGIVHRTSAPFHPATNGLAENAVGSFKKAISKALNDVRDKSVKMTTLISRYLLTYRNVPHCTTGECPAKLFLGRFVRTRLDLLSKTASAKARENQVKYFHGKREIEFSIGENVYARDYKNPAKPVWRKACISEKLGERTYLCKVLDNGVTWKRHVDQLLKGGKFYEEEFKEVGLSPRSNTEDYSVPQHPVTDLFENKKSVDSDREVLNAPISASDIVVREDEIESGNVSLTSFSLPAGVSESSKELVQKPTISSDAPIKGISKSVRKSVFVRDENLNVNQREKRVVKPVQRLNL